ncbi:MAG TPA: hypothetical protein IGS17_10425 [Oscillatoriales cyanobacterium M59_W2019_021]|nr:hypothetical protein [Oscillatoriales cyanobacterium M4454_W2019_049]HIK51320.1 hypothetical protein [Oscillatoriales cyanobacterium M59_W2019_021]
MNLQPESPETLQIVGLSPCDRWLVYQRLQELDIPCHCELYQPLRVRVPSLQAAIQLWSAVRSISAPRQELVSFLERCWMS